MPSLESPVYMTCAGLRIFQRGLQLFQAARNTTCNRAGGQVEGLSNRLVALVAGEEPIEDLLAVLRERREHLANGEGLVELRQAVVEPLRFDDLHRRLA